MAATVTTPSLPKLIPESPPPLLQRSALAGSDGVAFLSFSSSSSLRRRRRRRLGLASAAVSDSSRVVVAATLRVDYRLFSFVACLMFDNLFVCTSFAWFFACAIHGLILGFFFVGL